MKKKNCLQPILIVLLAVLLLSSLSYALWLLYDRYVDRSGWVEEDGIRFYQDFHAQPVTGWLELEEGRYYFQEGGIPSLGWQEIGGDTYYFGSDGILVTGWLELDGKTHYFDTTGVLHQGWLELDNDRYYLSQGALATGWQDIDGARYYFRDDGTMARGFVQSDGVTYYMGEDGTPFSGTITIEGNLYLFQEDGSMFTGWQDGDDGRRYFFPAGPMALGWEEIDGTLYYFDEDGLTQTGWMTQGEYRYYFHPDGSAAIGPTEIDGQIHYFTPKGIEVILVNAKNPVPDYYEIDLVNVVDYHDVDSRCYDALVQMLQDCEDAGIEYVFNSAYRTVEEQTEILEYRTLEHMETYELTFEEAREKALETVAVPGTSEHHLGLAVDLLGDEAIAWFQEHCWDYGFIRRYYEDKKDYTGIIDEPWHFRYVGTEVSLDLKDSGLCLEEYLGAEPVVSE